MKWIYCVVPSAPGWTQRWFLVRSLCPSGQYLSSSSRAGTKINGHIYAQTMSRNKNKFISALSSWGWRFQTRWRHAPPLSDAGLRDRFEKGQKYIQFKCISEKFIWAAGQVASQRNRCRRANCCGNQVQVKFTALSATSQQIWLIVKWQRQLNYLIWLYWKTLISVLIRVPNEFFSPPGSVEGLIKCSVLWKGQKTAFNKNKVNA